MKSFDLFDPTASGTPERALLATRTHRRCAAAAPSLAAALLLAPAFCPQAAEAGRVMTLRVGTQQELMVERGVERIALADEAVAGVAIARKERSSNAARLILTGRAAGSTTLMVWEKGSAAATTYVLEVERRPAVLEGSLPSVPEHERAAARVLDAHPKDTPLLDRSVIDVRGQTVQVEVRIVEFSRSVLKEVGLSLSSNGTNRSGFRFSLSPARALSNAFNLALGFQNANQGRGVDLGLSLLESNGLARVLAEPTLVALSGQSASFLAGGELPIPVPQGLGTTTLQYKPFGIGLSVTPTVLANDRIALKVAPEASDLDYGNALNLDGVAVPAITTRRADTAVELGDGETFVIGGLVSRSTVSNADKVPFLGNLPVIGNFFKQQTYQMNEKELVILVTPRLVRPIARGVDLAGRLPGGAEQRDGPVWRAMFLGDGGPDTLPGFSR